MLDPILNDKSLEIAKLTLDGLAQRQEVIGQNLANVDTPGYQAQTLNFEDLLKRAMNGSAPLSLESTNPAHISLGSQASTFSTGLRQGGSWRSDGNDVDIDVELNQMAETGIRYQAITQLVSQKFSLLKALAVSR